MISSDLPITKSTDDKLNRAVFAKNLAETVMHHSFPAAFTIGLYGEWGSGKTSLVNMLLETIENSENDAVILRFNPWLCSDSKQLITQFFKQLASAIKLKKSKAEKAWELIDQYADIFDAANLIPGIGALLAAGGKALGDEAKRQVERRTTDLQNSKNQIISKMIDEKLKIIVSIDDIDRLSEDEIIAVFQLVKALADFPNTVYILTFDYNVVVRALSKVQHGDGKEYLEKIIQVPFEIPAPNMDNIHQMLFAKLQDILGDIPDERWDKASWSELYQYGLKRYVRSIRDVIRYTNVFLLKYQLLKNEVDPVDLLALTALQVFEPSAYSKLPSYKELLCGSNQGYTYERQKEDQKKTKDIISMILQADGTIANMEAAENILGLLFPKMRTDHWLSYGVGRNYSARDFLINNNIAVKERFDRYFALSLEDSAIPTERIKYLIYSASEKELCENIIQLYAEGKIIRLLEEIEAYAHRETFPSIPPDRAALIVSVLVQNWNNFEVEDSSFFSLPFDWRLLFCVDPLLMQMDSQYRFTFACSLFNDRAVQPSTVALLLQDFEHQCGRLTESTVNEDNAAFPAEKVIKLEELFKKRAIEAVETGNALTQRKGLHFFGVLEQIDPELAMNKKKTIISDDISLVKVIDYCTIRSTTAVRTVFKSRSVKLQVLSGFIDIKTASERIDRFVNTDQFLSIPEDEQMSVIAFIHSTGENVSEQILEIGVAEDSILKELEQLKKRERPK